MTVQNLAQFVADIFNNTAPPGLGAQLVDTSGTAHSAGVVPIPVSGGVQYVVVDTNAFLNNTSYTATQVNILLGSTVVVSVPVNVNISPKSNAVAIQVNIVDNTGYNFAPVIQAVIIPALMGILPQNANIVVTWDYTVVTYGTTTTSTGTVCSSTVSSTTTGSTKGVSASGSGMTLTLSVTISYGSCQQIQNPTVGISTIVGATSTIPVCTCNSSICGYNTSCSVTASLQVSL